jgi:formamidopyrimidine-DNA glycosylase
MPELPEVETMVLGLRESILGHRVQRLRVQCDRLMRGNSPAAIRKVAGGRVIGLSRKGKYLLFHLSNGAMLVFHLRMTGRLVLVPSRLPLSAKDRARLDFTECDWALCFEDQRRFGSLAVVPHGDEAEVSLLDELGPDALRIGLPAFRELLADSRRPVKALLLDQRALAGLGNIYVDESLHRAGIHPRTPAADVPAERVRRLHAAMRSVLRKAITCGGSSVSDFRDSHNRPGSFQEHHRVYKREGQTCPSCETQIRYIRVASRGTRFCPTCQREPGAPRSRR